MATLEQMEKVNLGDEVFSFISTKPVKTVIVEKHDNSLTVEYNGKNYQMWNFHLTLDEAVEKIINDINEEHGTEYTIKVK